MIARVILIIWQNGFPSRQNSKLTDEQKEVTKLKKKSRDREPEAGILKKVENRAWGSDVRRFHGVSAKQRTGIKGNRRDTAIAGPSEVALKQNGFFLYKKRTESYVFLLNHWR